MVYLTEEDVLQLVNPKDALTWVADGFDGLARGNYDYLPRQRLVSNMSLSIMAASRLSPPMFGAKMYIKSGTKGAMHVLLWDGANGKLLAMIEANYLGAMRTAAASVFATQLLGAKRNVIVIIGAGFQAAGHLVAYRNEFPDAELRVVFRSGAAVDKLRGLTEQFGNEPVDFQPFTFNSKSQALRGVNVITTATTSSAPVLFGRDITPGVHVNATGSNDSSRREVDLEVLNQADVVAVDDWLGSSDEAGDLIQNYGERNGRWNRVVPISGLVRVPFAREDDTITLFLSQGFAVEDLVMATNVYDRAVENGIGTQLNPRL